MVLISKLKPQAMGPSTNRDADNICLSTYIMYYKKELSCKIQISDLKYRAIESVYDSLGY
jgi:hypothetical protein